MLRIKYFEEFRANEPSLVVLSDKEGLKNAYEFLRNQREAYLDNSVITSFSEIYPLPREALHLTTSDCQKIAPKCIALHKTGNAGHDYFETKALGEEIEGIISYGEYEDLF